MFFRLRPKKIREKYQIKDDETVLLLVSRLTEEKNISFLFDVVAEVLKKNPKAKFMLVGDGYLKAELEKESQKRNLDQQIIFAGLALAEEIKNYYAAGDIFVYASKSETQGMIITEAMYMGLPIVAVKATGIESLVEENVNGFLTAENKEEFIKTTQKLLDDAALRQKMSAESSRIAREKYTASASAEKMLQVYVEAIEHKKQKI